MNTFLSDNEFQQLVVACVEQGTLPKALEWLKACDNKDISSAASALSGHFALAEVEGQQRIYHVFTDEDDQGEEQEYLDHIMNEGDDVVQFVAWFFYSQFDIKDKDTYQAAGKPYSKPKRN